MKQAKALTITYLTPVSFASLNGGDKEADNISSIKKIAMGVDQYPYVSSQAVRRALAGDGGVQEPRDLTVAPAPLVGILLDDDFVKGAGTQPPHK